MSRGLLLPRLLLLAIALQAASALEARTASSKATSTDAAADVRLSDGRRRPSRKVNPAHGDAVKSKKKTLPKKAAKHPLDRDTETLSDNRIAVPKDTSSKDGGRSKRKVKSAHGGAVKSKKKSLANTDLLTGERTAISQDFPSTSSEDDAPKVELPGAAPTPPPASPLTSVEVAREGNTTAADAEAYSNIPLLHPNVTKNGTSNKSKHHSHHRNASSYRTTFTCAAQLQEGDNVSDVVSMSKENLSLMPYGCTCSGYVAYGYGDLETGNWSTWYKSSGTIACGLPQPRFGDPAPGLPKECVCFERLGGICGAAGLYAGPWWCIALVAITYLFAELVEGYTSYRRTSEGGWPDVLESPEGGMIPDCSLEAMSYALRFGPSICALLIVSAHHPEDLPTEVWSPVQPDSSLYTVMGFVTFAFVVNVLLNLAKDLKRLTQHDPGNLFDAYCNRDGVLDRKEFTQLMKTGKISFEHMPLGFITHMSSITMVTAMCALFIHACILNLDMIPEGADTLSGNDLIPTASLLCLLVIFVDMIICSTMLVARASKGFPPVLRAIVKSGCVSMNFAPLLCAILITLQAYLSSSNQPYSTYGWVNVSLAVIMLLLQPLLAMVPSLFAGADLKPHTPDDQFREGLVLVTRGENTRIHANAYRWISLAVLYACVGETLRSIWFIPGRVLPGGPAETQCKVLFLAPPRLIGILLAIYGITSVLKHGLQISRRQTERDEHSHDGAQMQSEANERRVTFNMQDVLNSFIQFLCDAVPLLFIVAVIFAVLGEAMLPKIGIFFKIKALPMLLLKLVVIIFEYSVWIIVNFHHFFIAAILGAIFAYAEYKTLKNRPELAPPDHIYGAGAGLVSWIPVFAIFIVGYVLVRPADEPGEYLR